jgi:hypothetical protein
LKVRKPKSQRVENAGTETETPQEPISAGTESPTQQSFTTEATETPGKRNGTRISFSLDESGQIDWGSMREKNKVTVEQALRGDARVRTMIAGVPSDARMIQPKHVGGILSLVEFVERMTLPKMIEAKTEGRCKANPELASKIFKYTDEERKEISEPGAIFLDDHLPLTVKTWIARSGPGAEMLAALAKAEQRKLQMYVVMAMSASPAIKSNGDATAEPLPISDVMN